MTYSNYPEGMTRRDLIYVGAIEDPLDTTVDQAAEEFSSAEIFHIDRPEAEAWLCDHGFKDFESGYCVLTDDEIDAFADAVNEIIEQEAA